TAPRSWARGSWRRTGWCRRGGAGWRRWCARRWHCGARSGCGAGRRARALLEHLVDAFLDGAQVLVAEEAVHFLPVLEEDAGRHAGDAEARRRVLRVVDVDLEHAQLARVLRGDGVDGRRQRLAGLTPAGSEIDQNGL